MYLSQTQTQCSPIYMLCSVSDIGWSSPLWPGRWNLMPLDHMPQLSPQPLEQSGSWGPAEHTTLSSNSLHLRSQSIGCVAVFSEVF